MKEFYTTVVFKHIMDIDGNPLLMKYEDKQVQWAADETIKLMLDDWLAEANAGGTWGKLEYVIAEREKANG